LPAGNWIVFYSFVIDHEIPFAYERPLCAKNGPSSNGAFDLQRTTAHRLT
jgi:hypothetical protein